MFVRVCVCIYFSLFSHALPTSRVLCDDGVDDDDAGWRLAAFRSYCVLKLPPYLLGVSFHSSFCTSFFLPPPLFRIGQVMLIGSACVFSFRVSCWSASLWQRLPNSIPMTKNILVSRAFFIKRCVLFLSFLLEVRFLRLMSAAVVVPIARSFLPFARMRSDQIQRQKGQAAPVMAPTR